MSDLNGEDIEGEMRKEERVEFRLTKEEKKLLEADAKKEERTISNLLLWCWKQWRGRRNR